MKKEERIDQLIEELNTLNYHYYTLDEPLVSDGEYDKLYDELVELERETGLIRPNSPTQRVGGEVLEGFEKHNHIARLWSLQKSQSFQELLDWEARTLRLIEAYNEEHAIKLPSPTYILEYKFDGLTINLTYNKGELVQAATRGNGVTGEGILPQIRVIRPIPKKIKFQGLMEVQGEGLMPLSALEKYNETAEEPLKNARNAAAGALRNLDTNITKSRNLTGYFYNVGYIEGREFKSHLESLEFLRENLIPVYPYLKEFRSMEELIEEIKFQDQERKNLDVLTDGLVIKIKDIETRNALGYTNRFPRWAIAYKFEAEEFTTRLLEVIWNVGRTGKVTPSALVEPVEIGGATVRRATLNNYDDIERKKLRLKSRVLIRRSNDVIPEILGVVDSDQETFKIERPETCPACGTKLIQDGVHIFCKNSLSCKPQLISRLVHFASRDAMNIEGFSDKTAILFLEELDLRDLPELYEVSYEDLMGLPGFKERKSTKLLEAIERSKKVQLSSFIYALGIENVGIKTAGDLANHYRSLDNLLQARTEELVEVGEIGEIIAKNIVEFFSDPKIQDSIDKLLKEGVRPYYEDIEIGSSIFTDKTVVITGSLEGMARKEAKAFVESLGGKVTGSVSSKTDYLIAGENPGSKYKRAVELGIDIIGEDKFKEIIKI